MKKFTHVFMAGNSVPIVVGMEHDAWVRTWLDGLAPRPGSNPAPIVQVEAPNGEPMTIAVAHVTHAIGYDD